MKQRNYKTNCLRVGSFAGRAIAQALAIALATFFSLFLIAPALAVETLYTANSSNSVIGTFTLNTSTLTANPTGSGAHTYNYTSAKMTISAAGSYAFGQSSAPVDTVMIVYNGTFDPLNPEVGVLAFDDDGGANSDVCGSGGLCPKITKTLTTGQVITLVISTYNAQPDGVAANLSLPLGYAANGPGTVAIASVTAPNAPTSLSATPGDTQVSVAFTPPSSNGGASITNYEHTTDGGTSWVVFSPSDTSSPVVITGLTNGTSYTIGLRAVNTVGAGDASATVTSIPFTIPNAPTSLTTTPVDTQVSVAFTPPSSNGGLSITNYEYSTDGGTSWAAFSPADTSSPVAITGLTNGTTYAIGLRAVSAAGSGTAAAIVTSIAADTPNAPTGLSATAGDAQVSVAFTPPSNNGGSTITNYEYSTDGGTTWTAFAPADISSPVTITGLTNGTTYAIGLRAVNAAGSGTASANVNSTPLTIAIAPTGLSVTPADTQISVAFTPPSNNGGSTITNYEYSTDGGTTWTAFAPADTSSPVTITGLTNGTTYAIGLRAVNAAGSGTASASVNGTPMTIASAPTGLSATAGDAQVSIAFASPSNNGGSTITNYEYSTDGGTTWTAFAPADTSSPVTITGLTNGTTYAIGLRAVNAAGSGTASANVISTPLAIPSAPTGLIVTAGDAQVSVAFTPPSSNGGSTITNHEYTTDGGTSWTAFAPADTASPVTITGLVDGTAYSIGLRAVNAVGQGTPSENVTGGPQTIPGAPTGLSATAGDAEVSVAFTPPSSNGGSTITNYQYTTDDGRSWTAFTPTTTASPVTITGLVNGTTYTIGLRAINAVGPSPTSTTLISTPLGTPNAPTSLIVTPGSTEATVAFTPPSNNGGSAITAYEYTLNGGVDWTAFIPTLTTSPATVTGLTNGSLYTIGLRAVNAVGPGAASASVAVTPMPNPTTPSAPTDLSATPGDTQIEVAFSAPVNNGGAAITNYEYTFDDGISWAAFNPTIANSSGTITGLTNNVEYTIKLRAVNSVGKGAKSVTSVTATPTNGLAPPTAPTSLSAAPGGSQIEIKFTEPVSDGGSAIINYEYTTDGGASWTAMVPATTSSPVTIAGLANGSTYAIGLRAVNAVGPGAGSQTVVTATPLAAPAAPMAFEATPDIDALGGDGQVSVEFVPAADPIGAPITNYQYSLNGGISWIAFDPPITSSPATITGLTNGVGYTIALRGVNSVGPGVVSTSAQATPMVAPNAPTNLSATTNATQATVAFTPPSNTGGAPITNYEYSFDDGITWTAFKRAIIGSPATFTGLTRETTYVARLRAVNAAGSGTASHTVTFSFGSPGSAFKKNKTKILNMVVGDATRGLQSLMTSNRKLMLGARARFIRQNKKTYTANVDLNTDVSVSNVSFHKSRKKTDQFAFVSTKNERPVACIKLFGCGDPDFDISGSAQLRRGVLSTSGQFIDQDSSEGGSERRLVFGDFDVQHDSKSGSTISTFNGKLLLEKTVNRKTVLGSFLGIETANSNIAGEFTGGRTSWGPSLGGYVVHELSSGLYADAIMSFYRGNKSIDVSNGVLDLRSNYDTWAATYRASLSGVIERRSFEIWPELSLSHGTNSIDSIGYNANAYGLVGGGTLDAGSIDITKLMLRPEVRIPIDGLALTDYMSLATFAPRLMCEEITTNAPTLYAKNRSCGQGAEYGLVSQSDDGLTEFRSKVIIDNIGDSTRTGISINFNYRF